MLQWAENETSIIFDPRGTAAQTLDNARVASDFYMAVTDDRALWAKLRGGEFGVVRDCWHGEHRALWAIHNIPPELAWQLVTGE